MDFYDLREPVSAWSHGLWLALSLPVTVALWRRCGAGDPWRRFSVVVFGLGMAACYLGSMLYHGVRLDPAGVAFFDRLDHVGIHLLIAASYTPIAWVLLRGAWRRRTLLAVWAVTLVSCALLLADRSLPTPLATGLYLAVGWGSLFCYVEMARVVPSRALRPLILGGAFYSVGAVLNVLHWPNPWPGVVGSHEVFHLWVMAGTAAHVWFLLRTVVPFVGATERPPLGPKPLPVTVRASAPPRPPAWPSLSRRLRAR